MRDSPQPGLCGSCLHCRQVKTGRSVFYLCERSFTDARFVRYPRLPVVACPGYEKRPEAPTNPQDAQPPKPS